MRLLLIAYEFPPSPSPQSLRWAYLCRELSKLGHEIHVLTVHLGGLTPGLPDIPEAVQTHRAFAGPLRGSLAVRRDLKKPVGKANHANTDEAHGKPLRPPRSWKQGVSEWIQKAAAWYWFPDIRGEWKPSARRMLEQLLPELKPDAIISSHEPATTLELGLLAQQLGYPWLADLGDPVLAPYTPSRWIKRSRDLEEIVCKQANHITVTNELARQLLSDRHGRNDRISVISQGFDPATSKHHGRTFDTDARALQLLYTGSLYGFRKIDILLDALEQNSDTHLGIASVTVPESILERAQRMPDKIRLLGFLPHKEALLRQRQADVLIDITNDDPTQVPGKFYEYLGSGRPILQIGSKMGAAREILEKTGRGWQCENVQADISTMLEYLVSEKQKNALPSFHPNDEAIAQYSWPRLALEMESALHAIKR